MSEIVEKILNDSRISFIFKNSMEAVLLRISSNFAYFLNFEKLDAHPQL